MFPKAHAAAYGIDAIRLMWYKIYHPVTFYAAYFSAAPDGFDSEIVMGGKKHVHDTLWDMNKHRNDLSAKDNAVADALMLVNEYYQRGYDFLPVDLKKSTPSSTCRKTARSVSPSRLSPASATRRRRTS